MRAIPLKNVSRWNTSRWGHAHNQNPVKDVRQEEALRDGYWSVPHGEYLFAETTDHYASLSLRGGAVVALGVEGFTRTLN